MSQQYLSMDGQSLSTSASSVPTTTDRSMLASPSASASLSPLPRNSLTASPPRISPAPRRLGECFALVLQLAHPCDEVCIQHVVKQLSSAESEHGSLSPGSSFRDCHTNLIREVHTLMMTREMRLNVEVGSLSSNSNPVPTKPDIQRCCLTFTFSPSTSSPPTTGGNNVVTVVTWMEDHRDMLLSAFDVKSWSVQREAQDDVRNSIPT
jgi:hypothetical protein